MINLFTFRHIKSYWVIIILCFIPFISKAQENDTSCWHVYKIVGSNIHFVNGKILETSLKKLKVLGMLQAVSKAPYLILSGKDCYNCTAPERIYVQSPDDGPLYMEENPANFAYPGHIFKRRDSTLTYSSRCYFGLVLKSLPNAIIWYQQTLLEDGKMHNSIYLLEVIQGKLHKRIQYNDLPDISETEELADKHFCKEIPPYNYLTEK